MTPLESRFTHLCSIGNATPHRKTDSNQDFKSDECVKKMRIASILRHDSRPEASRKWGEQTQLPGVFIGGRAQSLIRGLRIGWKNSNPTREQGSLIFNSLMRRVTESRSQPANSAKDQLSDLGFDLDSVFAGFELSDDLLSDDLAPSEPLESPDLDSVEDFSAFAPFL